MKTFFCWIGRLLKWGCIAFTALCLLGLLVLVLILSSLHRREEAIQDHSILVLNLDEGITDRPVAEDSSGVLREVFGGGQTVSLRAVTKGLREAAKDKRIAGVY